jgi:hypothetical protein
MGRHQPRQTARLVPDDRHAIHQHGLRPDRAHPGQRGASPTGQRPALPPQKRPNPRGRATNDGPPYNRYPNASQATIYNLGTHFSGPVQAIASSPNGDTLYAVGTSPKGGGVLAELKPDNSGGLNIEPTHATLNNPQGVACNNTGTYIAVAAPGFVDIFDNTKGEFTRNTIDTWSSFWSQYSNVSETPLVFDTNGLTVQFVVDRKLSTPDPQWTRISYCITLPEMKQQDVSYERTKSQGIGLSEDEEPLFVFYYQDRGANEAQLVEVGSEIYSTGIPPLGECSQNGPSWESAVMRLGWT